MIFIIPHSRTHKMQHEVSIGGKKPENKSRKYKKSFHFVKTTFLIGFVKMCNRIKPIVLPIEMRFSDKTSQLQVHFII